MRILDGGLSLTDNSSPFMYSLCFGAFARPTWRHFPGPQSVDIAPGL